MTYSIHDAARLMGGQACLARAVGVKPPTLQEWLKGKRPIPAAKCAAIEKATLGRVTVEMLLPGGWSRIPDAQWPHPEGRPVVDVTRLAAGV